LQFWETISDEHGIMPAGTYTGDSSLQLEKINVYYNKEPSGNYRLRSIFVDLEPSTKASLKSGPFGQIFRPENVVYGEGGGDKNWAEGYCGKRAELVESVLDIVMTEVETCDCLQGFQLTHSLAGGTGGGLGSLLISKIREEYSKSTVSTYSVFRSSGMFDSIIEPYNVRLSITKLIDGADFGIP
jgi:tubulin beta